MRLAEIIIENYRGISNPIRVKIDEIVVLIGNNNVGKTTILKAYEAFSSMGKALNINDFYMEKITNNPTITGVFVDVLNEEFSDKWIHTDQELGYDNCIKAQYRWYEPGVKGIKYSFDPESGEYIKGGMGGFDSILASRIPTPIPISPLDKPEDLEKNVLSILTEAIKENTKKDNKSIEPLLNQIEDLAATAREEISEEIESSTRNISIELEKIFPYHNHVEIDAKAGKLEPDKLINAGSFVRIGNKKEGHMTPLSNHGTGLQRTFLWAALKMLAETGRHKVGRKTIDSDKQKVLLIEEPEVFLHPSAIKEARESLYAISKLTNWQVMVTSHSPMFIDLTKDHTTIIRLDKQEGTNHKVKTFTTDQANFTEDDKENLKMLNFCDPYFNEFFFAKNNLLVEGETEYTVTKSVLSESGTGVDFHIINCLGKANIVTVSKILNHFSVPYSILHDTDCPRAKRKGNFIANGAWTLNEKIIKEVLKGREAGIPINTFISVPDFEGEFMDDNEGKSKPYEAWKYFREQDNINVQNFIQLLESVQGISECPQEYRTYDDLVDKVNYYIQTKNLEENPLWQLDIVKV